MTTKTAGDTDATNRHLLDDDVNPALQTSNTKSIDILFKAKLMKSFWSTVCPSSWDYQDDRHYFHVLENGYEANNPVVMPTFLKFTSVCCTTCCFGCDTCINWLFVQGLCTCIPRNNWCNGVDVLKKSYFDRGVFDRQSIGFDGCCGNGPILGGSTKVYEGSSQYICCCVDCPEMGNQCMECYFTYCCGGRVFVQPYQTICGYDLTAFWLCNCFSLCGLKDGQPLCLLELVRGVVTDDAKPLRDNVEFAYNSWFSRVYSKQNN